MPKGEEIYTDQHGRIKVQFYWDREGQANEQTSCWIRVNQPVAGIQWGGIALPRIGQEVIIDFEHGDPDRPVMTGRVYNGQNKPPYPVDDGQFEQVKNGQQVFFTAPLSQVEHGYGQANELLNAFGTDYAPDAEYTMLLMDRSKLAKLGDTESIIPTFDNLNKMIAENPNIGIDPDIAKQVLNSDFAPKYEAFSKAAQSDGIDLSDPNDAKLFASKMGFSAEETTLLMKRHEIAKDISAWDIFQGNGMTRDTNFNYPVDGPVEVFTLDRNPLDLGYLESEGALTRIKLN